MRLRNLPVTFFAPLLLAFALVSTGCQDEDPQAQKGELLFQGHMNAQGTGLSASIVLEYDASAAKTSQDAAAIYSKVLVDDTEACGGEQGWGAEVQVSQTLNGFSVLGGITEATQCPQYPGNPSPELLSVHVAGEIDAFKNSIVNGSFPLADGADVVVTSLEIAATLLGNDEIGSAFVTGFVALNTGHTEVRISINASTGVVEGTIQFPFNTVAVAGIIEKEFRPLLNNWTIAPGTLATLLVSNAVQLSRTSSSVKVQ